MTHTELAPFVDALDHAMQTHMDWTRRVLRCAVLRSSPGDDVLSPNAAALCEMGKWLDAQRDTFDILDAQRAQSLNQQHQSMHGTIRSLCRCILDGQTGSDQLLDEFDVSQHQLIESLAHFKTLAIRYVAKLDPLTGLSLRHSLEQDFESIAQASRRSGTALAVIIIDVDHFKSINDRYGHATGDDVLRQLGQSLKRSIRNGDLVYRFGGEEFVILLNLPPDRKNTLAAVERLQQSIRGTLPSLPDGTPLHVTATIGVALLRADEALEDVFKRADAAMYRGKAQGRNRCVIDP